jgi:hypothetical protein
MLRAVVIAVAALLDVDSRAVAISSKRGSSKQRKRSSLGIFLDGKQAFPKHDLVWEKGSQALPMLCYPPNLA